MRRRFLLHRNLLYAGLPLHRGFTGVLPERYPILPFFRARARARAARAKCDVLYGSVGPRTRR